MLDTCAICGTQMDDCQLTDACEDLATAMLELMQEGN